MTLSLFTDQLTRCALKFARIQLVDGQAIDAPKASCAVSRAQGERENNYFFT